jgi:hypothetical protein
VYIPSHMPLSLQVDYNSSAFVTFPTKVQKRLSTLETAIGTDPSNLQQLSDALGAYIAADQAALANSDQRRERFSCSPAMIHEVRAQCRAVHR